LAEAVQPELLRRAAKQRSDWPALLVLLIVTIPWWMAVRAPFILFDDPIYVTQNPGVLSGINGDSLRSAFTSFRGGLWSPLTFLSLTLDVTVFGSGPAGMHFTNVLLHVSNAILFYWFLRTATGNPGRSLAATALWAVHPLRVESVAWVTERKDVLAMFFGLWAMLSYLAYIRTKRAKAATMYVAMCAAYALSLMAKPMLVPLPLILLLLDGWPLNRWGRTNTWALIVEKTPLLALAAVMSVVTSMVQRTQGTLVGTDVYPISQRVPSALLSYVLYLRDQVAPTALALYYPPLKHIAAWQVIGCIALLCAITAAVAIYWRKAGERLQTNGAAPLVGWLWFLGALAPVIGLVQSGSQSRADRYTYFPAMGLIVGFVWLWPERWPRRLGAICGAVFLAGVGGLTILRLNLWQNPLTLYADGVEHTGGHNPLLETLAGQTLEESGQMEPAFNWYLRAIKDSTVTDLARYRLGRIFEQAGRRAEALQLYGEALAIKPSDPEYRAAYARMHGTGEGASRP
jgi:hypothetical protein